MNPFYEKREQKLQIGISENMHFPEHLHEDMEFLLVLEGQIEVTIMGNRKTLHAGDCAVIFPEMIHSYQSHDMSRVYLLIFDASFLGRNRGMVQKYCPVVPFLHADKLSSDIRLALERLYEMANKSRDEMVEEPAEIGSAWIHVLLAYLIPQLQLEERKTSEQPDIIGRLVPYIMEHYREALTLEGLAKALHVNKYYLSHVFSERMGMNFRQYLNQIRLEQAMHEIRSTDHAITRIWEEAGFNSQRSFNRIFQNEVGMTPMEYRKHCQMGEHSDI